MFSIHDRPSWLCDGISRCELLSVNGRSTLSRVSIPLGRLSPHEVHHEHALLR